MNRYLLIIPVLFVACSMYSQSMKAYIAAGEEAMIQKDFYSALVYYLDATEFDTSRLDLQYKVAESARLFNAYNLARDKYQYVVDRESNGEFPMATFWLADIEQKVGNYPTAKALYEMYLSEHSGEVPFYTAKATKEIKACDWAIGLVNNPDQSVQVERLGEGINTVHSEFGALKTEDWLYFSSLRYEDPAPKEKPVKLYSKILQSPDQIIADTLAGEVNMDGKHVAHTTFNPAGNRLYYTICDYEKGLEIRCDIYMRAVMSGKFGPPVKLPALINSPEATNTQPHCTYDSIAGKEILYFVSDRENGKGELDIWYSFIEQGRFYSEPVNLEVLNTPENDITPFYHQTSNTLFFSSEGYQRLGGYDIYKSQNGPQGFTTPAHLPVPYNSSYHDLYFTQSDDKETAFFSSNRPGSLFIDDSREACCYDIYRADISPLTIRLNAQTFDRTTQNPLPGATVRLLDAQTGEVLDKVLNDLGNDHVFELEKGRTYIVIGDKTPYISDTVTVSTTQISTSQEIVRKLFLELEEIMLDVFTFDAIDTTALIGATVTLVDLTDMSVQDVIELNEADNDFHFTLVPGRTYRVTASKPNDYIAKSIIVDTSVETGDGHLTRDIFLERRDLNIYLPLTLFFDNDLPDRKSWSRITASRYSETYNPYVNKKNLFLDRTGRGLQGEQRILEVQRMDDFFEFDVKGGFEKLHMFLDAVLTELNNGNSFDIRIKGYASPLATSEYNKRLSERRVYSVRNEVSKYRNGILIPFMNSNHLRVTDVSFGEDMAPSNVSDDRRDVRNSIYSVEASKERRVEIIEIENTDE